MIRKVLATLFSRAGLRGARGGGPRPGRLRARPTLEALEPRYAPAVTLTWDGPADEGLWSMKENWNKDDGTDADSAPVSGDSVRFDATCLTGSVNNIANLVL